MVEDGHLAVRQPATRATDRQDVDDPDRVVVTQSGVLHGEVAVVVDASAVVQGAVVADVAAAVLLVLVPVLAVPVLAVIAPAEDLREAEVGDSATQAVGAVVDHVGVLDGGPAADVDPDATAAGADPTVGLAALDGDVAQCQVAANSDLENPERCGVGRADDGGAVPVDRDRPGDDRQADGTEGYGRRVRTW
ncbi:hypothetical protein GCM10027614_79730 [Micromonospora vulcania]